MIRDILRIAAAAGVFAYASIAQAENFTIGKLVRIGTGVGGEGLYLTLDQPTNPVCPSGMIFMPTTASQYKETFSTALLALSQGMAITVYYTPGCTSAGNISLDAIAIGPGIH